MLRAYRIADGGLHDVEGDLDAATLREAQWIDLCDATDREKKLVTETLDIALSPLEDYEPFQVSSHFSATDKQLTLTGLCWWCAAMTSRICSRPRSSAPKIT